MAMDREKSGTTISEHRLAGSSSGKHGDRIACEIQVDESWAEVNYSQIYRQAEIWSQQIIERAKIDQVDPREQAIAFLFPSGWKYISALLAIWRSGAIAVPLSPKHPLSEWNYILEDASSPWMILDEEIAKKQEWNASESHSPVWIFKSEQREQLQTADSGIPDLFEQFDESRDALMIYTSGSTGAPKGVVHRFSSLKAQVENLIKAWAWTPDDVILHVLPLHHVHGLINALLCPFHVGARIRFLPKFDTADCWKNLCAAPVSVFMAVPTIYRKLIQHYDQWDEVQQIKSGKSLRGKRLMISGSAALAVQDLERWKSISGHTLLERYGMTEIGMALSNPYVETQDQKRRPGWVGSPLGDLQCRVSDEQGNESAIGQLLVKGSTLFDRYWNKAEATEASFRDGWFETGDMVEHQLNGTVDEYRIVGRLSTDIIKTGAYKVSALDIEKVVRDFPAVADCAIVGVPDPDWGEVIALNCVCNEGLNQSEQALLAQIQEFCSDKLASYKIPRRILVSEDLPRNAMGKVLKKEIQKQFVAAE
jgi:malonyl-CoA/methylmalonyl-CoA synthetase